MSQKPSVIHVINGLRSGGAEIMLLNLVKQASNSGFAPIVVSLDAGGDLIPAFEAAGVRVEVLHMRGGLPDPRSFARLVALLRKEKPAAIQAWMYHANLISALAAQLAGRIPVAWGIHHTDLSPAYIKPKTYRVAKTGARLSHRLPRAIVCCAEASRRVHAEIGYAREKMIVIPNGFDTERFRPDPAARIAIRGELGLEAGTRLIGMLARFNPQKDHQNFVRAAGELARTHPEVHYLLAGFGNTPENVELATWIAEVGLSERFHLVGNRTDTARVNAALDVAVLSSQSGEAFPLVIGEAMASGVPCAVTDVGDSALVVGDLGRVAPPKTPAALAHGIAELLDLAPTERARVAAACRRRIADTYNLPRIAMRYEELWLHLQAGVPFSAPQRSAPCV